MLKFVCVAAFSVAHLASAAFYAPNRFLGTCLTEEWVRDMETELGVSASARNPATSQLLHPFLHAALPGPRYSVICYAYPSLAWNPVLTHCTLTCLSSS